MGRKKMKTAEKVDVRLRMDTDMQEEIQQAADKRRVSVAAYIRAATLEQLKRDKKEDSA